MDDEALRVHADALIEAGDPQGELIQVQLAREADPDNIDLQIREAQLLAQVSDRLAVDPALGEVSFQFRRGIVDGVNLERLAGDRVEQLAATLPSRAATARALSHFGDVRGADLARLATAIPSIVSVTCGHVTDDIEPLIAIVGERLEELALFIDRSTPPAIARALHRTPLPRLRRASVFSYDDERLLEAASATWPSLEALTLDAPGIENADFERLLAALTRAPRELTLVSDVIEPGAIDAVTRDARFHLRALSLQRFVNDVEPRPAFSLDEIRRLLSSPAAAALDRLELLAECTLDGDLGGAFTSASAIRLSRMSGEAIERLVCGIAAPSLRELELRLHTHRVLASNWLDGVTDLTLAGLTWSPVAFRRPTVVRRLCVDTTLRHLECVFASLDLTRVRSVANWHSGTTLGTDAWPLLFTGLPGLVEADLRLEDGATESLPHTPAPPGLVRLDLAGTLGDDGVAALAAWRGAAQLRYLALQGDATIGTEGFALLADPRRFPRLELLEATVSDAIASEVESLLRARFGPGWVRPTL